MKIGVLALQGAFIEHVKMLRNLGAEAIEVPFCFASRGLCGSYSSSFRRIWPLVRSYTPVRILINVDLPAPFSPTRQWTVFRFMSKLTSSTARTPGNSFTRSLISRTFSVGSMHRSLKLAGGKLRLPPPVFISLALYSDYRGGSDTSPLGRMSFHDISDLPLLNISPELIIQPIDSIFTRHRPEGNVVSFVEVLFRRLRGGFHLAACGRILLQSLQRFLLDHATRRCCQLVE